MNGRDETRDSNRQGAKAAKESTSEPAEVVDALAQAVIGAAIEVHRVLGPGYLESVYQTALEVELGIRAIQFESQKPVSVIYKGQNVGNARIDLLVGGLLVVELKAADGLLPIHRAQVISYLKATGCELGLLINFHEGVMRSGIKRVVLSKESRNANAER